VAALRCNRRPGPPRLGMRLHGSACQKQTEGLWMGLEEALLLLNTLDRAGKSFDVVNQAVRIALAHARAAPPGTQRNEMLRAAALGLESVQRYITTRNASLPDAEGLAAETKVKLLEQFLLSANPPTVGQESGLTPLQARARTLIIARNLRISEFRADGRRKAVFSPEAIDASLVRAPVRWQPENIYEVRQRRAMVLVRLKALLRQYPTCLGGRMSTARLLRHMHAGTSDNVILQEASGASGVSLRQAKTRLRDRLKQMVIDLRIQVHDESPDALRWHTVDDVDQDFAADGAGDAPEEQHLD
jgi:hypothetical protein